jgi:double-stranded uracil-DNA glycosylase
VLSDSFSPVATPKAKVLVLGSLPGRISLKLQQYYAQPRNTFWKLVASLYGFEPSSSYPSRIAALNKVRVALWDVCASAYRPGSLDSAIDQSSVTPNDFTLFLSKHQLIHTIFFNGQKAATLFSRLVEPSLNLRHNKLEYVQLPSSSPAHAALPFDAKLMARSKVRHASEN